MAHEARRGHRRRVCGILLLVLTAGLCGGRSPHAMDRDFDVEVRESTVYATTPADNGAGPLWNYHTSNIVRIGETVWVSGLNTVTGLPPLNNTQCTLWKKTDAGWGLAYTLPGLTREPCPLGLLKGERLLVSTNATLNPRGKRGGGPARPAIWENTPSARGQAPVLSQPNWRSGAKLERFTEHSYRSLAVDGSNAEIFLMQNVGNSHAEWAFRDADGMWSAQGRLDWPIKRITGRMMPLRVCYVVALVDGRGVYLLGVSDVVEPNKSWREFKHKLTGNPWDYVFRNLYYTWTPDISREPFRPWLEVASRESSAGRILPGDLWRDDTGAVHILWEERALDERLRDAFFPDRKQRHELKYAVVNDGKINRKASLVAAEEGRSGPVPHFPKFFIAPEQDVYVFFYVDGDTPGGGHLSENRMARLSDGKLRSVIRLPIEKPLDQYVVSTSRTGNEISRVFDVLGYPVGSETLLRHVSIEVHDR